MNFKETFEEYMKTKNDIALLKKKEKELVKNLMKIPANKTKDGIMHGVTIKRTVKYSEVLDQIIEMFVPRTKKAAAYQYIEDNKVDNKIHSFEEVK